MSGDIPLDGDVRGLYEYAVSRSSRWEDWKEEIEAELLGQTEDSENEIKKRVEADIRTHEKHDELLTAVASAFNPRSRLSEESGWYAVGVEPLYEVDPTLRNPDAIIGHEDRDILIVVECKTGLAEPQNALQQLRGAADNVLEYRDYLIEEADEEFETLERVLMVPGSLVELAKNAIDDEERNNSPEEPVFLWTYHTFSEERLRLHRHFQERTETESAHNNQLSQYLSGEGVEVIRDPLASGDFYPESSPLKILRNIFFDVPDGRDGADSSIRKFTRGEVHDLMDSQRTMTHYATDEVADILCDNLLSRMRNYGLIEVEDPSEEGYGSGVELYSYNESRVSGMTPSTIQSNLVDAYKTAWIEQRADREAVTRTVEEFMDGQSGLFDFD